MNHTNHTNLYVLICLMVIKKMNKYSYNKNLIRHLEQKLGLLFEKEPGPDNLCFANQNSGLRNEFKRIFTPQELHYYTLANPTGPLPEDTDVFWQGVEKGKQLPR